MELSDYLYNLFHMRENKFVLIIGDDGVIATYITNKTIKSRIFVPHDNTVEQAKVKQLLESDRKASVSILVDVIDQTYTQQSLPAVSALNIGKLVKSRLEKDYGDSNLKGAIPLGRQTTGRKDWDYTFVSTPIAPPLSNWLEYLQSFPNEIRGIHLLPVEASSFLHALNKAYHAKGHNKWQCIVTSHKVGGLRQTIFHNGSIFFTRHINLATDSLPEILAGNIEQELLNTIEYLKRGALSEGEQLDVFILTSNDVAVPLKESVLPEINIEVFTPYEIAQKLGITSGVTPEDQFSDMILTAFFAKSKPTLTLHTPATKKVADMLLGTRVAFIATFILVPFFLLSSLMVVFESFRIKGSLDDIQNSQGSLTQEWEETKRYNEQYKQGRAAQILEAVNVHAYYSKRSFSPLTIISKMGEIIQDQQVYVKGMFWNINPATLKSKQDPIAPVSSTLELEFSNKDEGFDTLFENFDKFINELKTSFASYKVEYTRLPKKISFSEQRDIIPLQLTIKGPYKDKEGR